MTKATPEQVMDRFAILPQVLQDAYWSDSTDDAIFAVADRAGFTGKKRQEFIRIGGLVFVGFIHPDTLAAELKDALEIDEARAKELAGELDQKVFAPYRKEIERVYAPPGPVRPDSPIYKLPSQEEEERLANKERARLLEEAASKPKMMDVAPAPRPAAQPLPHAGAVPPAAPLPAQKPAVMPAGPITPPAPKPITPTAQPATPSLKSAPATPAPFMMQKQAGTEPIVKSSGFRLDVNPDLFKKTDASGMERKPFAVPPKPAQLELGKTSVPSSKDKSAALSEVKSSKPEVPRVVHYSEFRPSLGIPAATPAAPLAPKPVTPSPLPDTLNPKPIVPAGTLQKPSGEFKPINPFAVRPRSPQANTPLVPPPTERPKPAAPADLPVSPLPKQPSPSAPGTPIPPKPTQAPKIVNFGPGGDMK